MNKELTITFTKKKDGTIITSMKPPEVPLSALELFMAYKQIQHMLDNINFDWSVEGQMSIFDYKKEEETNGK